MLFISILRERDMMKVIQIEIKSVKGFCSAGYKAGDKLIYCEPNITSADGKPVCIFAVGGLIPYLSALGKDTDKCDWINDIEELQCPDPVNTVIFSLKLG